MCAYKVQKSSFASPFVWFSVYILIMSSELPATHWALVLQSRESELEVQTIATPQPDVGSAVVRVVAASVLPSRRDMNSGAKSLPFPTPLVTGYSAIGRIVAVGSDTTSLTIGQLVYADCVVRARDDPSCIFLLGHYQGSTEGSKKLMRHVWRDGTFAEYAKVPLENCVALNETRLCSELGYSPRELAYMAYLLVPFGGLRDIGLQSGETIVVCPATGFYGSMGVQAAAAIGARVIAMGRNEDKLVKLKRDIEHHLPDAEIETVLITGDKDKDAASLRTFGAIDAILDITPSAATTSTHTRSAIKALRHGGRISVMGSSHNIGAPEIMIKSIQVKGETSFPPPERNAANDFIFFAGKMMYERHDIVHFTKMLERRLFTKGHRLAETRAFALEDWKEALDIGAEYNGIGKCVIFAP